MYDVEHSHVKQETFRETEQEEEQRIFEEVNTEEGKVLLLSLIHIYSYFCRSFREYFGSTPEYCRKGSMSDEEASLSVP